jgi:hypothetical protein
VTPARQPLPLGYEDAEAVHTLDQALGLEHKDRLSHDTSRGVVLPTKLGGGRQLVAGGELTGRNLFTYVIRELRPLGFGGHLFSLVCTAI